MVNTYQLINPYIEGLFESKIKSRNSKEAANIFYKNLSEHFNNSIPSFYFTIQKGSSSEGKYFNYLVKETKNDDKVNFEIIDIKSEINVDVLNKFKTNLDKIKIKLKTGGSSKKKHHKKHKKDDSESSDSSDTDSDTKFYKRASKYLKNNTQPIYYWWYYPYLYPIDYVYIPTFYSYITPYIELSLLI
jgi:hypothetical protein